MSAPAKLQATVPIEAAMRGRRGATVVVKYGGAAMGDEAAADLWARDVVRLARTGLRPVVVHGGGPALTRMLSRLGIESTFVDGLRVTSAEAAEVAEMVLSGRINKDLVSRLHRAGGRAIGLSGTDGALLRVRPMRPGGRDIGFVADVESVDTEPLILLLERGYTPVLSSTAADENGRPYNINADHVAGAVAAALRVEMLIFLTDVGGLSLEGATVSSIGGGRVRHLLDDGSITGGMRPKLEAALTAVDAGVPNVHLVDGREPHALVDVFMTGGAAGTRITAEGARTPIVPAAGADHRAGPRSAAPEEGRT